jgi:uncharacterized protein
MKRGAGIAIEDDKVPDNHGKGVRPILNSDRRRPKPSDMSRQFWLSARSRTLVRPVCEHGHAFFPPQIACPYCLSESWTWHASLGRGHIYSYTIVHRAPEPGFVVPYVLAIIDLDDGWTMLANVVNCQPDDVRIGMPVRVEWQEAEDGFVLPVFEPDSSAGN